MDYFLATVFKLFMSESWILMSYVFVLSLFLFLLRPVIFWDRKYGFGLFESFYQKRSFLCAAIVCGVLIFMRTPQALLRAEFWAEDMTEFFLSAMHLGAKSVLTPVYGYLFLVERLVAWVATFLPVLWAPYVYAGFCFLVTTLTSCYLMRDGFSWLIADKRVRFLLCATFAIGPGTPEVHFNFSNLASPLTWLAALVLLEHPLQLSFKRFLAFLLLAASAGQTVLLIPLIVALFLVTRSKTYLALLLSFIPIVLVNLIGNHQASTQHNLLQYSRVLQAPQAFIENFFGRLLVIPLFGPNNSRFVMRHQLLFWIVVAVGCYFLRKLFKKENWSVKDTTFRLLFSLFFGFVGLYVVVLVSRAYSLEQIFIRYGKPSWGLRYSCLSGCAALVIWFSYIGRYIKTPRSRLATGWVRFLLLLLVFNNVANWKYFYFRPDLRWPERAAGIQEALDLSIRGELATEAKFALELWAHPVGWRSPESEVLVIQPELLNK